MANKSDGSIYIDTKIDTEGFKAGSDRMKKAAQELVDAYDGVGGTAEKQMKKAATAFDNATRSAELQKKKIVDLDHQIKAMSGEKVRTAAFESLNKELDSLATRMRNIINERDARLDLGFGNQDKAVVRLNERLKLLEQEYRNISVEAREMARSGTAFESPDTSGLEKKKAAAIEELRRKNLKALHKLFGQARLTYPKNSFITRVSDLIIIIKQ